MADADGATDVRDLDRLEAALQKIAPVSTGRMRRDHVAHPGRVPADLATDIEERRAMLKQKGTNLMTVIGQWRMLVSGG